MNTLELFSGTKSFSKVAAERGHKTLAVDSNPSLGPDVVADVLKWNPPAEKIEVLWASPPCTAFSVASIGANWTGGRGAYVPKTDKARLGIRLVQRTLDLISEINPTYWFIENPRGVLRKMPFMDGYRRVTVWYCRYGEARAKPTDIWTNVPESAWNPRPPCANGNPDHEAAPRGSRTGTQGMKNATDRGAIPPALFEEIFDALEKS